MAAASDSAGDVLTIHPAPGNPDEAPEPRLWLRRGFAANLSLMVVILAILTGLATYVILTGLTPIQPTRNLIIALLGVNSLLIATMAVIIGWQVWRLLVARRQRIAGAGLHLRLVGLLSLSAVLPALIVAVFATVTLNRGLDAWFSERTQSIVETSVRVALSYIEEQGDLARSDVEAMAANLSIQAELFESDRQLFIRRLATFAAMRGVHGAFLIDAERKRVEANITANDSVVFRAPDQEHLDAAADGEVVVVGPGDGNVIRGLARVEGLQDRFIYIYRLVNPELVEQLAKARDQKSEYDQMLDQRAGIQLTFALMYAGVTFVFLLAAVWLGLWFADRLVEPIVGLVHAARRVSRGDLHAKVRLDRAAGDLATLGQAFNQMTEQLQAQRNELVAANDQLDTRRRFTEAVLAGVTAGVVGLDSAGRITLVNRSAVRLLRTKASLLIGRPFPEAIEAMRPVYEQALAKSSGSAQVQVNMKVEAQERSFVVRVSTGRSSEHEHGCVVTFDDITELVAAQRNSAWADIARRIAHEIKNPLTPIQLSAERLKRKYRGEITTDPQVFEQCTETIIRQVGDIGRMVDEFSAFARMPSAALEPQDLGQVVKEAMVLQRVSASDIEFGLDLPDSPLILPIDRRLVAQAVTNLVKNAKEAIEARPQNGAEPPARIKVSVAVDGEAAVVEVVDNGIGLPRKDRGRLTEPYMTTREKGTGLGLAIVKRIMEEHGGDIELMDAPDTFDSGQGALVRLIFPMNGSPSGRAPPNEAEADLAGDAVGAV
jgi:two-component system, NtrC family, nitrogen regulation sensor histidine kinase NtrY